MVGRVRGDPFGLIQISFGWGAFYFKEFPHPKFQRPCACLNGFNGPELIRLVFSPILKFLSKNRREEICMWRSGGRGFPKTSWECLRSGNQKEDMILNRETDWVWENWAFYICISWPLSGWWRIDMIYLRDEEFLLSAFWLWGVWSCLFLFMQGASSTSVAVSLSHVISWRIEVFFSDNNLKRLFQEDLEWEIRRVNPARRRFFP